MPCFRVLVCPGRESVSGWLSDSKKVVLYSSVKVLLILIEIQSWKNEKDMSYIWEMTRSKDRNENLIILYIL